MKIICPNCDEVLAVTKQNAKSDILCPYCTHRLMLPSLKPTAVVSVEVVRLRVPFIDVAVFALKFLAAQVAIGMVIGFVVWWVRFR